MQISRGDKVFSIYTFFWIWLFGHRRAHQEAQGRSYNISNQGCPKGASTYKKPFLGHAYLVKKCNLAGKLFYALCPTCTPKQVLDRPRRHGQETKGDQNYQKKSHPGFMPVYNYTPNCFRLGIFQHDFLLSFY